MSVEPTALYSNIAAIQDNTAFAATPRDLRGNRGWRLSWTPFRETSGHRAMRLTRAEREQVVPSLGRRCCSTGKTNRNWEGD